MGQYIRIAARVTSGIVETHYYLYLSVAQVRKYDNGAMISCGLSIPDDMPLSALNWLIRHKRATEIKRDEWNHSGCQSYCVLRGDKECRW